MNLYLILMLIAFVATVGALVLGIIVMNRGGEVSKRWSNKLMRARVVFQLVTVGLLVLAVAEEQKQPAPRPAAKSEASAGRPAPRTAAIAPAPASAVSP